MARVNRTTGVFLVLGVVILIMSVSAAWYVGGGQGRYVESQGQSPNQTTTEPADEKLDVIGRGVVDVRSRLSHPSPLVPGRVATVEVTEGQRVSEGAVLLRVDDRLARSELKKLKGALELARFDINKAMATISEHQLKIALQEYAVSGAVDEWQKAKQAYDKVKKLQAGVGGKEQEVKIAELTVNQAYTKWDAEKKTLETLKANIPNYMLDAANRQVQALEDQAKEADKALENYIVRAPKRGRVFRLNVSAGDHFAMPAPNQEPRITFCPDDELIVRAEINQESAQRVQGGEQVEITLHGPGSGKSYTGRVDYVSPWVTRPRSAVYEPDQINDARFRECLIRFDTQPDEKELVVGTRLRVRIKMN
jgi:multidrug resistance efflux pump